MHATQTTTTTTKRDIIISWNRERWGIFTIFHSDIFWGGRLSLFYSVIVSKKRVVSNGYHRQTDTKHRFCLSSFILLVSTRSEWSELLQMLYEMRWMRSDSPLDRKKTTNYFYGHSQLWRTLSFHRMKSHRSVAKTLHGTVNVTVNASHEQDEEQRKKTSLSSAIVVIIFMNSSAKQKYV